MAAQTEYQRGFIDGLNKMKYAATKQVLDTYVPMPDSKEEQ